MTKKDYERAASLVQGYAEIIPRPECEEAHREGVTAMTDAFIALFKPDNGRFDEDRFRRACVPGANVRARG